MKSISALFFMKKVNLLEKLKNDFPNVPLEKINSFALEVLSHDENKELRDYVEGIRKEK
jgi:hypothetical protein